MVVVVVVVVVKPLPKECCDGLVVFVVGWFGYGIWGVFSGRTRLALWRVGNVVLIHELRGNRNST